MTQRIDLIRPVFPQSPNLSPVTKPNQADAAAFKTVLERQIKDHSRLKFSQHAQERLAKGQTILSPQDMQRLDQAVEQAARKGARESLILIDDLALIVSVSNRTVVTAVNGAGSKENIFTNIDSAVILKK